MRGGRASKRASDHVPAFLGRSDRKFYLIGKYKKWQRQRQRHRHRQQINTLRGCHSVPFHSACSLSLVFLAHSLALSLCSHSLPSHSHSLVRQLRESREATRDQRPPPPLPPRGGPTQNKLLCACFVTTSTIFCTYKKERPNKEIHINLWYNCRPLPLTHSLSFTVSVAISSASACVQVCVKF